jgi:hypothetical protein
VAINPSRSGSGGGGGVGGGTATLTTEQTAAIGKVATIETELENEGAELAAGSSVPKGSTRTYTVGDVVFTLQSKQADRTAANPIDAAELNKWTVVSQFPALSTTFPVSKLIPKGYRLLHTDGSILNLIATGTTGATITLADWKVEVQSLNTLNDWVKESNNDYATGQKVITGDTRVFEVTGILVTITYRGTGTLTAPYTTKAISATELANWKYLGQASTPTVYPGAVLAPKGFQYQRAETGQLLELKTTAVLPATFAAGDWEQISKPLIRVLNGETFDLLAFNTSLEKNITFYNANLQNGPANSAQGANGQAYYSGDAKNGQTILTILSTSSATNDSLVVGVWRNILKTTTVNAVEVSNWDGWKEFTLARPFAPSSNNMTAFTGSKVLWNLTHNINPFYLAQAPLSLKPLTTWADYRVGSLRSATGALVFEGTIPTAGTEEITLTWRNAAIEWVVGKTSTATIPKAITIHNFGVATATALKGALHSGGEAHLEGGGNYSIAAADWEDGQWVSFTHTAGVDTGERLTVSGFAGAYLRDGSSRDISGGLPMGKRDCLFLAKITSNGGQKYLNVKNESIDAASLVGYANVTAPVTSRNLVNIKGTTIARANAVAPNALPATHYVDVLSGTFSPLYVDGCIFDIPSGLAVSAGQDLFLGANGAFSLTAPAVAVGNIRQPVAVVRHDLRGQIKLRDSITHQ